MTEEPQEPQEPQETEGIVKGGRGSPSPGTTRGHHRKGPKTPWTKRSRSRLRASALCSKNHPVMPLSCEFHPGRLEGAGSLLQWSNAEYVARQAFRRHPDEREPCPSSRRWHTSP